MLSFFCAACPSPMLNSGETAPLGGQKRPLVESRQNGIFNKYLGGKYAATQLCHH